MKSIFLFLLLFALQAQAQLFHETKSYELMYIESDLVVQAKHIGNKNVIIKEIYNNDDENFKTGDTLYIGWLSEFELRSPPSNVFLFLKKVDPASIPAYNTIDVQPVANSRYEHVSDGVIWFDTTGTYRYTDPDHGYMRLTTVYTDSIPVFSEDISKRLRTFAPYFDNYLQTKNMKEDTVKAQKLASYLFRKNTPAPSYYELFAEMEMRDPHWTEKAYEYSHAMIPYFKQCDDTTKLAYPLQILRQMHGGYNEFILLNLEDLLNRNVYPADHQMIIRLIGDKGDEYAIAILRDQLRSKNKQDKQLAALTLYTLHDKPSLMRIKKILLNDEPDFLILKNLFLIEPEKTQAFIKENITDYPERSKERMTLTEISK